MAGQTKRARNLFLASLVIISSVSAAMWIATRSQVSEVALITKQDGSPEPVTIDLNRPLPGELTGRAQVPGQGLPANHPPIPAGSTRPEPVPNQWPNERLEALRTPAPGQPTINDHFKQPKMDDLRDKYRVKGAEPDPATVPTPLMITSAPPGMRVEVNGILMGITPLYKMMAPATKDVKVKIVGPGFRTVEKVLRTEDGRLQFAVVMDRIEAPTR